MSIAALVQAMLDVGASGEAILVAIKAVEGVQDENIQRKAVRAEQKRKERARKIEGRDIEATVARQSHDIDATNCDPSLETKVSPKPPSKTQSLPTSKNPPMGVKKVPSADEFSKFWEAYGHKVERRKAQTAFDRARRRGTLPMILAGVERAKASRQWLDGFVKNPATWLNADCWLDEPSNVVPHPASIGPPTESVTSQALAILAEKDRQREQSRNQG